MTPSVLILFTRYDTKNATVVEWIKSTLDTAGMSCELSEGAGANAARRARLVIVPLAGYGWRGVTNTDVYEARDNGVPILAVAYGETRGLSWTALEEAGALRDPLTLTDLSSRSADQLIATAWAKVETTQLELNVAMYASPGLENALRRVLAILSDMPEAFGNRINFRPLIWPTIGARYSDATVCLLWHDLHTVLGGNDWATNEWQTLETPSVLLFYQQRPKDADLDFDGRIARLRRDTVAADEFIERTLSLKSGTPPGRGGSKAGHPAANFERQLREYLEFRVKAAVRLKSLKTSLTERPELTEFDRASLERVSSYVAIDAQVPSRFKDSLERAAFYISPTSPGPTKPPRDAASEAHFAAFAPQAVEPGRSFLLEIWACAQGAYEDMLAMARRREGVSLRGSKVVGAPAVGTVFDVAIDLPSFTAAETTDVLLWTGGPTNASFVMTPLMDIAPGWHVGTATMSVDSVPFTRLRFEIQVGRAVDETRDLSSHEQRVSSIFASYASVDRIDVLQWARGAQAAGVNVFLDVLSLRESADWERELFNVVPTKDLFCLFWSAPAKESIWVEREWRCALAARGLDYIHPVPLEDPREVSPPAELSARHFGDPTFLVQQYEKLRGQLKARSASNTQE